MVKSANELGLKPKMFGGGMVGLQFASIQKNLGPLLNGIINYDFWVPEPTLNFPGVVDFLKKYQEKAKGKGDDWVAEAKGYGDNAKVKGRELATEGKVKASEGMRSLGRMVNDNAYQVDEKLGAKYGDYARTASKSLDDYAAKLDQKSVDDLVDDGREFVRRSPGKALGIAAVAGFLLSRLFGGRR